MSICHGGIATAVRGPDIVAFERNHRDRDNWQPSLESQVHDTHK